MLALAKRIRLFTHPPRYSDIADKLRELRLTDRIRQSDQAPDVVTRLACYEEITGTLGGPQVCMRGAVVVSDSKDEVMLDAIADKLPNTTQPAKWANPQTQKKYYATPDQYGNIPPFTKLPMLIDERLRKRAFTVYAGSPGLVVDLTAEELLATSRWAQMVNLNSPRPWLLHRP